MATLRNGTEREKGTMAESTEKKTIQMEEIQDKDSILQILKAVQWPSFGSALKQSVVFLLVTILIGGGIALYTSYIEQLTRLLMS